MPFFFSFEFQNNDVFHITSRVRITRCTTCVRKGNTRSFTVVSSPKYTRGQKAALQRKRGKRVSALQFRSKLIISAVEVYERNSCSKPLNPRRLYDLQEKKKIGQQRYIMSCDRTPYARIRLFRANRLVALCLRGFGFSYC